MNVRDEARAGDRSTVNRKVTVSPASVKVALFPKGREPQFLFAGARQA
jgi:hypothetical protein